jgi:hypothetical protein
MDDMPLQEAPSSDTPPRPRRRKPPPVAAKPASVVLPVVGLVAFVGLVGIGLLLASRRRTVAPHTLSIPHLPAIPVPHLPAFNLHRLGRFAAFTAAQAIVSDLVRSIVQMRR